MHRDTSVDSRSVGQWQSRLDRLTADRYPEQSFGAADAREQALAAGDAEYLACCLALTDARAQSDGLDWPWLSRGHRASPRDTLRRIQAVCRQVPELYAAMLTLMATQPALDRLKLAQAARRFRSDLEAYTDEDVKGLLTAAWVGGKEGFEAVLRTRRKAAPAKVAMGWAVGAE